MLNRLSTYDYVAPLKRERKKRYGSTSHWISATKEYDEWLRDNSSAKFWLSGILGSGKSVLTAAVVDDLLSRQKPKNSFLVFFFCQHDNANSLQARTIVGCLLRQCLTADTVSKENEDRLLKIFKEDLTEWDELRSLFRDVFDASQTIHHILIDGFDEVPRNERDIVFSTLATIDSFSRATVKVFLSSRHDIRNEVGMAFKNY